MKIRSGNGREQGLKVLCRLLGYTRQAYYKRKRRSERKAFESELLLREVIRIREKQKRVGARKLYHMTSGFRAGHKMEMGRDGLFDLLRVHSLLIRRRRREKPRTTVSGLWMKRYPNLARDFIPTAADQLWVSDITYIRIGEGFGYLSLVTDAYSRKIVGYHLSKDLSARGCAKALRMALRNGPERGGLIHHSDRGLQYYSAAYVKLLGGGARISMSERSDPLENAIAERVNGILKDELLEKHFGNFREASLAVDEAVGVYNNLRPHLSVDMLTPQEAHCRTGELKRRWRNCFSRTDPSQAMA